MQKPVYADFFAERNLSSTHAGQSVFPSLLRDFPKKLAVTCGKVHRIY